MMATHVPLGLLIKESKAAGYAVALRGTEIKGTATLMGNSFGPICCNKRDGLHSQAQSVNSRGPLCFYSSTCLQILSWFPSKGLQIDSEDESENILI